MLNQLHTADLPMPWLFTLPWSLPVACCLFHFWNQTGTSAAKAAAMLPFLRHDVLLSLPCLLAQLLPLVSYCPSKHFLFLGYQNKLHDKSCCKATTIVPDAVALPCTVPPLCLMLSHHLVCTWLAGTISTGWLLFFEFYSWGTITSCCCCNAAVIVPGCCRITLLALAFWHHLHWFIVASWGTTANCTGRAVAMPPWHGDTPASLALLLLVDCFSGSLVMVHCGNS